MTLDLSVIEKMESMQRKTELKVQKIYLIIFENLFYWINMNYRVKRHLYSYTYCSTIPNSQNLEAAKCSKWFNKEAMTHTHMIKLYQKIIPHSWQFQESKYFSHSQALLVGFSHTPQLLLANWSWVSVTATKEDPRPPVGKSNPWEAGLLKESSC